MTTKQQTEITETEMGLREILSGRAEVMSVGAEKFNVSVFSEVRIGGKEGIGIYYPIYRDGSCAEAQYFKFRIYENNVIVERANRRDIREYEKERLGRLLRR